MNVPLVILALIFHFLGWTLENSKGRHFTYEVESQKSNVKKHLGILDFLYSIVYYET